MEGANTVIFLTSGDKSDKIRLKKSYLERPQVDENRIFSWFFRLIFIRKFAESLSRCSRGEFFVDKLG